MTARAAPGSSNPASVRAANCRFMCAAWSVPRKCVPPKTLPPSR